MAMSAEDQRAITLQQQVSELEVLVAAACARGVDAGRCREVIDDAVQRARRKGRMLRHLDSQLLLSTLEQAKGEIVGLGDITATNAQLMREELMHHQERAEESAAAAAASGSEDVAAASAVSVPGTATRQQGPATSSSGGGSMELTGSPPGAGPAGMTGISAVPVAPPTPGAGGRLLDDASSQASSSAAAGAGAGSGGGGSGTARVRLAPSQGSLTPADAVAPIRDFASEVAAEASTEADEERTFRHALSMKESKSGDFRLAQSYDFETAQSPRASYDVRDAPFSPAPEGLLEGLLVYSRPGAFGSEAEQEEQEEEEDAVVTAAAPQPSSPVAAAAAPWRAHRFGGGRSGAGANHCWDSVPPGLNPMASVEGSVSHNGFARQGSIDPQSPTGMGAVDLHSYSSAPFTLHSVTPPRHAMDELAAEMAGLMRM